MQILCTIFYSFFKLKFWRLNNNFGKFVLSVFGTYCLYEMKQRKANELKYFTQKRKGKIFTFYYNGAGDALIFYKLFWKKKNRKKFEIFVTYAYFLQKTLHKMHFPLRSLSVKISNFLSWVLVKIFRHENWVRWNLSGKKYINI